MVFQNDERLLRAFTKIPDPTMISGTVFERCAPLRNVAEGTCRELSAISVLATLIVLGCKLTNASASPATCEADGAPGVHASGDCARGTGYVQIGNQDMSGSAVQVAIDGTRPPTSTWTAPASSDSGTPWHRTSPIA